MEDVISEVLKQVVENGFFITSKAVLKDHEIHSPWFYHRHFYVWTLNIFLLDILLTTIVLQERIVVIGPDHSMIIK